MNSMNYQLLGRSSLRVSDLCLGTMTFGEDWGWGSPKEEAKKIYDAFREAGGNFIDTANLYTKGSSERLTGEFIASHRAEVVLATKYTNAEPGKDANAGGNQRKNMVQALEASLKRLGTDRKEERSQREQRKNYHTRNQEESRRIKAEVGYLGLATNRVFSVSMA